MKGRKRMILVNFLHKLYKLYIKATDVFLKIIDRKLEKIYWLHIGDVLTPPNGEMTGGQYIVASRVLDIENRREGADAYLWQTRMASVGVNKELTPEMIKNWDNSFETLINSLDRRGYNPCYGDMGTITDNPLAINNGTHRLAYFSLKNEDVFLPYKLRYYRLSACRIWFPYNGEKYFLDGGLSYEEIETLKDRYNRLLKEVRTFLTGYSLNKYFPMVKSVIEKYGNILEYVNVKFTDDNEYTIFHFSPYKQYLYIDGDKIKSRICENIRSEIKMAIGSHWGGVADSVTESIGLENDLEQKNAIIIKFYDI